MAKRSPTNVITETITRPIARFIEIPSHILSRRPPDELRARPQGNISLLAIPENGMDLAALITGRTRHFLAFLVALRGPTLRTVQLPLDSTHHRFFREIFAHLKPDRIGHFNPGRFQRPVRFIATRQAFPSPPWWWNDD